MAENKTRATPVSVESFIQGIDHPGKREDAKVLDALFRKVTGEEPAMWGPTIIGYGQYHYKYDSGHEGDMCRVGFSPRKAKHSLYVGCDCDGEEEPAFTGLLERMGKYSRGASCIYVNKLADIDLTKLEEMVAMSWRNSHESYPE